MSSSTQHRLLLPHLSLSSTQACDRLEIGREWSHHTTQVLRHGVGDSFELCGEGGTRWLVTIVSVTAQAMIVECRERLVDLPPLFPLVLAQALTKGDKFDLILRMGTELGVTGFLPFLSSRCVSRPDAGRLKKRRQRWEKIVREASRQCQRVEVPHVHEMEPLKRLASALPQGIDKLVLWEGEKEHTLKQWVEEHPHSSGVALIVGPEGGLSEEEVRGLRADGFVSVSLGTRILRTETAGPAAAAFLQFSYDRGQL